jgi:hypothetical protein
MNRHWLALLLVPLLSGCSTIQVSTDWDRAADFSRYHTFRWAPTRSGDDDAAAAAGSLLDTHVRQAVAAELVAKGFQPQESGTPDLLLVYRLQTRDRIDMYRHSRYWGPSSVYQDREGTLTLKIVDPALDRVIWEGIAEGVGARHEESAAEIGRAVSRLLAGFPPGTP